MREFDLIQRFFDRPTSQRQVCLGIGDDGAILQVPEAHELVVVTDTLVEGVHFRATDAPDDLGYKALAVNLSDLAAMGAVPVWALLNLTLPEANESWLGKFSDGFFSLAAQYDVALVGGSLVDIGGHNPVEPASVATPVLMGQYTQSCQSVVDKLAEVGALYQPNNEFYQDHQQLLSQNSKNDALQKTSKSQSSNTSKSANSSDQAKMYSQLQLWLSDLSAAKRAGQAGAQLTSEQQAVLTQQLEMIETVMSQSLQGVSGREVL